LNLQTVPLYTYMRKMGEGGVPKIHEVSIAIIGSGAAL